MLARVIAIAFRGTSGESDACPESGRPLARAHWRKTSPAYRTGTGDESMREVRVNSERFSDSDLLHHNEAQTVDEAVGLVLMGRWSSCWRHPAAGR
jgi:hypothetical protein